MAKKTRPKPKPPTPRARRARAVGGGVGPVEVVKVKTPGRVGAAYEVRIGPGLLRSAADGLLGPGCAVLVVIDSRLSSALIEPLLRTLDQARAAWGVCVVTASEADKSLATAERAMGEAARLKLGRDGLVIGVGGGIVCDVAGFVASVFKRGVRVVQCPTTLLAMVDAAVGGKTGVNLAVTAGPGESDSGRPRLIKNAVGLFHQPVRVVCDLDALETLPRRELRCGLAECIKHGLIGGAAGGPAGRGLLAWTEARLPLLLALDRPSLTDLVTRNVALKARVVATDPFEESRSASGGRMMLNLGHTFAHALETLPGLSWTDAEGQTQIGPLKHGEAVGLGLLCAARVAEATRLVKGGLRERVSGLLRGAGLPQTVRGLPAPGLVLERMLDDKKNTEGQLRLILPAAKETCRVVTNPAREAVLNAITGLSG